MKTLLTSIIFTIIVALALSFIGPWFLVLLAPFLSGIIFRRLTGGQHFLAGLFGIADAYIILLLITQWQNASTLPILMGELFGGLSVSVLGIVVVLLGAIYGGVAQWCGHTLGLLLRPSTKGSMS